MIRIRPDPDPDPQHCFLGLFSRFGQTECCFSPDDKMVLTGRFKKKRKGRGKEEGKETYRGSKKRDGKKLQKEVERKKERREELGEEKKDWHVHRRKKAYNFFNFLYSYFLR